MERCPLSSLPRPRVTSLFADPREPMFSAFVISPACDEELIVVDRNVRMIPTLFVPGRNIEAVVSVPGGIVRLEAGDNLISSLDLRNASSLLSIFLASNQITSIADFVFPENLVELYLDGNPIDVPNEADLPLWLETLSLRNTSISSFAGRSFPSNVALLEISDLAYLNSVEGLVLPPQILSLHATDLATTRVSGVVFPPSLDGIYLGGPEPLTALDVRASDVAVLTSAYLEVTSGTNITACSDPRGSIQVLQNELQACVYPDEVFTELFPPFTPRPRESTTPTPIDDNTNTGGQLTNSPAPTTSIVPPVSVPTTQRVPRPATTNSSISAKTDDIPSTPPPPTNSLASSRRSNVLSTPAMVALVVSIALVAIAFVLRRRRKRASMSAKPNTSAAELVPLPRVANDVREDADFYQFQIPQSDLAVQSTVVVTSIYTSVYQAKLYGREVSVTRFATAQSQLGEEEAATTHAVQSFVDEIRLWATLDHPAIVAFVGVSWTQSDLSLVTERTEHGDLRTLIQREFGGATNLPPWFNRSGRDATTVWSKATIALDVAVALVYMHSFTPPVLHGDVSTTNVFVSSSYRAKLGNFGASGYGEGEDDAMENIGSSAMAPPEIRRGERYSVKADVYGLGTVISEMASRDGVDCPLVIRELVAACLKADPSDRPLAMDVHYRLRQAIASAH